MARTKASVGAKVSAGKSNKARCSVAAAPSRSGGSAGGSGSGGGGGGGAGNAVCARDTPPWQRAITCFFARAPAGLARDEAPPASDADGGSEPRQPRQPQHKRKRNVIESDDEEEGPEPPRNRELDESIHLEPLTGKDSHTLDEYYPTHGEKGKGVGKKTKGKENVNVDEKNNKREREESLEESVSKKVRIEC